MFAAINMQWLGVGIAALVVVALLIVVLVRHRGADERASGAAPRTFATSRPAASPSMPPAAPATSPAAAAVSLAPLCAVQAGSFLDEPLAHDFEGLGRPAAPAGPVSSGPFPVDPFGSHEDIFPAEPAATKEPPATKPVAAEESAPAATAQPVPAATVAAAATMTPPEAAAPVAAATAQAEPAAAPEPSAAPEAVSSPEPSAAPEAVAPIAAAADDPALLSDIIVTSGSEEVDLADPDVRDLLTQLVDDEIALARECQAQGQALDAILQLTEAEKASAALGLDDRLATVKALLADLQA